MRTVENQGDFDATIEYWTGGLSNEEKTIKKGEKVNVSGDLKKVQCLKLVKGRDANGTKVCRLKAKFASTGLTPFHSSEKTYTLKAGESIGAKKKHLREIKNIGSFDAVIEVSLSKLNDFKYFLNLYLVECN